MNIINHVETDQLLQHCDQGRIDKKIDGLEIEMTGWQNWIFGQISPFLLKISSKRQFDGLARCAGLAAKYASDCDPIEVNRLRGLSILTDLQHRREFW